MEEATKGKEVAEGEEKKMKKIKKIKKEGKTEKAPKEIKVVAMKHTKNESAKDINPATGSRFAPSTSKQIALELIVAAVKAGKNIKEIRKELSEYKKQNGKTRSLDAGYLAFCVASHPEYFETKNDGTIKLLKEFTPDPEAAKKLAEAKAAREAKKKERSEKKGKTGGKPGKPVLKKDKPSLKKAEEVEAEDDEDEVAEDEDDTDEKE